MAGIGSQILELLPPILTGGKFNACTKPPVNFDETSQELANSLQELMEYIQKHPNEDRYFANLFKHVYSPIIPRGFSKSGAECCEILFSGTGDSQYTIPKDEFRFLEENSGRLCSVVLDHIRQEIPNKKVAHISLGCGPHNSILTKDIPLARMCGVSHYMALDINGEFAKFASELVSIRTPNIKTNYVTADFTKKLPLEKMLNTHIPLLSLFGGTLGQFPFTEMDGEGPSVGKLLLNFAESTNYNGVLFATLDAETEKHAAESKYGGHHYSLIMNTFWGTAREVIDDDAFDPHIFKYSAEFDETTNSVLFVHQAKKETNITIKGKTYKIPKGLEIVIGRSQKTEPIDIYPFCEQAGWVPIHVPFKISSMVRGVALVGRNLANKVGLKSSPELYL